MSVYYEKFTRWLLIGTRRFSASAVATESAGGDPISAKAARMSRVDRRTRGRPVVSTNISAPTSAAPSPAAAPSLAPQPVAAPTVAAPAAAAPPVAAPPQRQRLAPFSHTETSMKHPGEILARHLKDLGLTASDLARDIDVPVNRVTGILNGQRGITADTALRLGHWFGVDPLDWMELQLQYELTQAEKAAGASIRKLPRLADRDE